MVDLNRRLYQLSQTSSGDLPGKIRFSRVFIFSLLFLFGLGVIFSHPSDEDSKESRKHQVALSRASWLEYTVIGSFLSDHFLEVLSRHESDQAENEYEEDELLDISGMGRAIGYYFTDTLLRIAFAIFIALPFWLIGLALGYLFLKKYQHQSSSSGILATLGISDRPFNSGINAILKPNGSISCTDVSCPGLACPQLASEKSALDHDLAKVLKKFGALNRTNLELIRIILAYQDFPSSMPPERSIEEEQQAVSGEEEDFVSNKDGTILQSAMQALPALLVCHAAIKQFYRTADLPSKGPLPYKNISNEIKTIQDKLPPLGKILLQTLIPRRGRAIASLPSTMIASAYLACEAGKCLVFTPSGENFTRISLYPHLQARAVLHSVEAYHQEYKGDGKLILRQAIICSRRHGDFGRAFIPMNMPVQSRALRDWLEVLFTDDPERAAIAELCELDAHLEELHTNLKNRFSDRIKTNNQNEEKFRWRGLPFKSVVLKPLSSLIEVCFYQVESLQIQRILDLMKSTQEHYIQLSTSSRLPGFKRQAIEVSKFDDELGETLKKMKEGQKGQKLVSQWLILRRMLTRYNWLSTRVGDSPVPQEGFVRSVIFDRNNPAGAEVIGFEQAVPLRQRRFKELLGDSWEKEFYHCRVHRKDIAVFYNDSSFLQDLEKKKKQLSNGFLDKDSRASA